MQRTLPKFIPSLILVGGLFISPLQLKRALHISTAKHHPAIAALMAAEELVSVLNSSNLITLPRECQKKVRQPSGRSVPSAPHVHPLGKFFSGEDRAGGVWAGRGAVQGGGVHQTPSTCLCVRAKAASVVYADSTSPGAPPEMRVRVGA